MMCPNNILLYAFATEKSIPPNGYHLRGKLCEAHEEGSYREQSSYTLTAKAVTKAV